MKHQVSFEPGHDCVRFECKFGSERCCPGSGGSHGVHGLNIRFVVIGREGAVQFLLYAGWLPEPKPRSLDKVFPPMAADLGYHSKKPRYDGATPLHEDCEFTGGLCYYDGSGLNADEPMRILLNYGDKPLWKYLKAYYRHVFKDAPFPEPGKPYPLKLRGPQ